MQKVTNWYGKVRISHFLFFSFISASGAYIFKEIVTMNTSHYRGILKWMKVLWGAA